MKSFFISTLLILCLGCAGTITTTNHQPIDNRHKRALIIPNQGSKFIKFKMGFHGGNGVYIPPKDDPPVDTKVIGNTLEVIQREIEKYSIKAEIAKEDTNPHDYDFLVFYEDTWRWDLTDHLDELVIYFTTPDGEQIIARSHFKIGSKEFHDYPFPEEEVPKMIKELIEGAPPEQ